MEVYTRFVTKGNENVFGDDAGDFAHDDFKQNSHDVQISVKHGGENYLTADGEGEFAIKFDDSMTIQTNVGENKGYEFYDWFIVGADEDYLGYSQKWEG